MIMRVIKRANYPRPFRSSEICSESVYHDRRRFLRDAGLAAGAASLAGMGMLSPGQASAALKDLDTVAGPYSTDETPNSWEDVTTYNNFYEFGTGKDDPYRNAQEFVTSPWTVNVSGKCNKPGDYHYEDLVSPHQLEDRIYRHRCVEAWSMVVPWVGIPLADMLKRFEPGSDAKYVRFKTLLDPEQMPGQRRRTLRWPYVEGLTLAEAMHPLTLMVAGVFGKELPNNVTATGADSATNADFARPLGHGGQHDVHDADTADQQRNTGQ